MVQRQRQSRVRVALCVGVRCVLHYAVLHCVVWAVPC